VVKEEDEKVREKEGAEKCVDMNMQTDTRESIKVDKNRQYLKLLVSGF
jgi:hypothetical protein